MQPSDLTPREGKVLRYFADRTRAGDWQIPADNCIVKIEWSDLPHTHFQAVTTLASLAKRGLVEQVKQGYRATASGMKLSALADKERLWMSAPPPSITNSRRK